MKEAPIQRDELGALSYEIDILLEIWNKDLPYDIEILNRVNKVITEWSNDIESWRMPLSQ